MTPTSVVVIPPPELFERTLDADELSAFLEVTKLSCCFFDEVFVDVDLVEQIEALSEGNELICADLKVLQKKSAHPMSRKTSSIAPDIFATESEVLRLFDAPKRFPGKPNYMFHANRVRVKFAHYADVSENLEFEILSRLSEQQERHHLAVYHLVGDSLGAHTHTVGGKYSKSSALESRATSDLTDLLVPDLSQVPLADILKQRNSRSFLSLRKLIQRVAERAHAGSKLLTPEDRVHQETLRAVLEDLSSRVMSTKQYSVKVATGLAGYIPIVSAFTNTFDVGKNTQQFVQDRNHWLSFFTALSKSKEAQSGPRD